MKTLKHKKIFVSLLLGLFAAWQMKGILTPMLLGGKIFDNRSLLIQIGIILILSVLISTILALFYYLFELPFPSQISWIAYIRKKAPIIFLVLVPITAHLLYSSLGFNPTDDGFTLAYSRRIIEGQIPHRDFIIIRPFLSPLLHIPFVLWGGDYMYLFSRFFVWFQLACIAWVCTSLIEKGLVKQSFRKVEKISIALISFAVSAHAFPVMAWHTIDGLFFISLGFALCVTEKPNSKLFGYILLGLAYLCKQSFIFVAPLTLIIIGDWRKTRYWIAIFAPGIIYTSFLLLTNALPDAILQLTSQRDFLSVGFKTYFNRDVLLGVLVGYFSTTLIVRSNQIKSSFNNTWKEWLGLLTLSLIPIINITRRLSKGSPYFDLSFTLFGLVVGVASFHLLEKVVKSAEQVKVVLLVSIMAWSASLSIGYNFPILVSGQLLVVLLAYTYPGIQQKLEKQNCRHLYSLVILLMSTLVLVSFGVTRRHNIYRDQAASTLTERLDAVLPGGKGIRTNENTYNFLVDLQEAIRVSQDLGITYAIIPDCAGWWGASPQANPLPIDWTLGTELNKPELVIRVIQKLESMRNTNTVIVQKVESGNLSNEFISLYDYAVVDYVRLHFLKVYETSFFELYK